MLLISTKCVGLKDILMSDESQSQRVAYCIILSKKKVITQNDRAGNRIMNEGLETGGKVSVTLKG